MPTVRLTGLITQVYILEDFVDQEKLCFQTINTTLPMKTVILFGQKLQGIS